MKFREATLDNGLEIIAECNPRAYSAAYAFFVKTGARDESPAEHGMSHFLEHMVFKGTARRSAADVNREFDEIGSFSNAYTNEEQTVYYASVLPEFQERVVDLLTDILRPALREEDFNTEKQVILEEIAKYEDQPPFGAHEKSMAAHYGDHALGRSVLGTVDSVTALTAEQMMSYFERQYSPSNIALVAAGNVDFEALVKQADDHCGNWRKHDVERQLSRAGMGGASEVHHNQIASQEYIVQIANGPATEDEDRFAARILATVFGDDSGSRLYWELVDSGLAEYASVEPYGFQGTGIYMSFLCCAPEDAAANLAKLTELQRQLEQSGVREEEIEQAKSKICSHLVLHSERAANRMFSVGNSWTQRRQYKRVNESVAAYQAVTRDDIHKALERYPLTDCTTVAVGTLRDL